MRREPGGISSRAQSTHPCRRASLNPSNKPPDLINFDAFADDSNLGSLSLSSPAPGTPAATAQSHATPAGPGGLPMDLFSSGPALVTSSSQAPSSSGKARQDPMAFFNTPQTAQAPPTQQYGQANMFASTSAGPSGSYNGYGFPNQLSGASPAGIALPITPGASTPSAWTSAPQASNGIAQPAPAAAARKDPFADLADLF